MKKLIVSDYGLNISLTPIINIIGLPSSGKTTLLRMLINQISNPHIYLDGVSINSMNINFKRQNFAACFDDFKFNTRIVKEELLYYQTKCGLDTQSVHASLELISALFALKPILNMEIKELTVYERALIKILALLIIKPTILGIDNLMAYLDLKQKEQIIKYAKDNQITLLNVTANSEELLLGTDIIILENYRVKASGPTKEILCDEKLLAEAGFNQPFLINLNKGLRYYDLITKDYQNFKSLVGALWK